MSNDQLHQNPGSRANPDIELSVSYVEAPIVGNQSILISGRIGFGEEVIITSPDGSLPFAEMSEGPAKHYQMGGYIKVNGDLFTESPEGGPDLTNVWGSAGHSGVSVVADNVRHPTIGQSYFARHGGTLNYPKGFNSQQGTPRTLYATYWQFNNCDHFFTKVTRVKDLSGQFETDPEEKTLGQEFTLTTLSGVNYTGYVVAQLGQYITLQFDNSVPGNATINGGTITTATASCVVDNDNGIYAANHAATKIWRIEDAANGTNPRTYLATSPIERGVIDLDCVDASGTAVPRVSSPDENYASPTGYPSQRPGEWVRTEIELDFTGTKGVIRVKNSHKSDVFSTENYPTELFPVDYLNPAKGFCVALFGLDIAGSGSVPNEAHGLTQWFEPNLFDNSLYRWVLGDAATLDDCTAFEVQEIVDRNPAAKQHKIRLHPGALSTLAGRHLILVGPGFSTVASIQL